MVGRRRSRAHKIDTVSLMLHPCDLTNPPRRTYKRRGGNHVVFNWDPTLHGSIDTEMAICWPSPGILWGAPEAQQPDCVLSVIFILSSEDKLR